jgi:hypothetical protein
MVDLGTSQALKDPCLWKIDQSLTEPDRKLLEDLNACVLRLAALRPTRFSAGDQELHLSKIAWKLKSLVAALLHRLVALADGAAVAMNARSTLVAMLAVRALIETVAVTSLVRTQLRSALERGDIAEIDRLIFAWLMATRDAERLSDWPEAKATNIITVLEKLGKASGMMKEVKAHYEWLSEICHPNSSGGFFMFGKMDRETTAVTFVAEQYPEMNLSHLLAGLVLVLASEDWINDLVGCIPEVGLLHKASGW